MGPIHNIHRGETAQLFLTNQASVTKLSSNLATQLTPSKDINELSITEIVKYMKTQFDPKR